MRNVSKSELKPLSVDTLANTPAVSIIVPVFNESAHLDRLLAELKLWHAQEVIIVDGGSSDRTADKLASALDASIFGHAEIRLLCSEPGRARQMQHGADAARSAWYLFVHADTALPHNYKDALTYAEQSGCDWGRFDVSFELLGTRFDAAMKVIAFFINTRSRLSRIATGDQAIFVRASVFDEIGGFSIQPLMEDIDLCRRLKARAKSHASRLKVITSPRRWQHRGIVRTVLLMWFMRLAYWLKVPATTLAKLYANIR